MLRDNESSNQLQGGALELARGLVFDELSVSRASSLVDATAAAKYDGYLTTADFLNALDELTVAKTRLRANKTAVETLFGQSGLQPPETI